MVVELVSTSGAGQMARLYMTVTHQIQRLVENARRHAERAGAGFERATPSEPEITGGRFDRARAHAARTLTERLEQMVSQGADASELQAVLDDYGIDPKRLAADLHGGAPFDQALLMQLDDHEAQWLRREFR